jgi:hypothetical protein
MVGQLEAFVVMWNRLADFAGVDVDKGDIMRVVCFSAEPFLRECSLLRGNIGCDACLHFEGINVLFCSLLPLLPSDHLSSLVESSSFLRRRYQQRRLNP